jgi:predicted nucleic acid-binding protein
MRLFLDANVLFTAAHNPSGKALGLVRAALADRWRLVTSGFAADEARRNLLRKYPEAGDRLDAVLAVVRIVPSVRPDVVGAESLPEKDRLILAAAIACRATHLLTGDLAHFGPLMNRPEATGGLIVQTVAEFLAARLAEG